MDFGDAADDRGAPNVDGEAPRVATGWFRHVSDGTSLTAVLATGWDARRATDVRSTKVEAERVGMRRAV